MSEIDLHIISFNVPFPANYGGVIDVFYKLKKLHEAGLNIHLHCYQYGRAESLELEKYTSKVSYYPRTCGFKYQLSFLPYIVKTRQSNDLINNLLKDNVPILFEGLHACAFLSDDRLKNRLKIVRAHNVEHDYYFELGKRTTSWTKKFYFWVESWKLKRYEKILKHADLILAISEKDAAYFSKKYPTQLVMPFHANNGVFSQLGKGDYVLYHGNLMVPENYIIALWIIKNIFTDIDVPLIIAGNNPNQTLYEAAKTANNVTLISNPSDEEMRQLISNAQLHLLFTEQATGLKLKLLYALSQGRFCICNSFMLAGSGIEKSVRKVEMDSVSEVIKEINLCFDRSFSAEDLAIRKEEMKLFDNERGAKLILKLLERK